MLSEDSICFKTRFTNTMLLSGKLWPNDYDLAVHFTPQTDDQKLQNITYEKYKWVFGRVLQNSIFITNDKKMYKDVENLKNDIIDFVSDPVDQIIGVTIMSKLNSIGGEYLKVQCLEIESWQGENLRYTINADSPEWDVIHDLEKEIEKPWWLSGQPNFSNFEKTHLTWEEIGFTINAESKLKLVKGGAK